MTGLSQEVIEKLSRPIIKVLKGGRDKNLRKELWVKCYTIKNINRDRFLGELRKFGNVNITDWNHLSLYEIKGVDPFDLENLIELLRKTLTLN